MLFAASATLCAVAGDFSVLLVGRALQGIASACCFTTSLAVIDVIFDSDRRVLAVGLWGAAGGLGSAIGPLLAGGLSAAWSWRGFFAVNIPFGVVSFVLLATLVPPLPSNRRLPVDVVRLGALTVAVALTVGGLQHAAPGGWGSAGTLVPLALGVGIGAVLVAHGRGREPLVPKAVTDTASFRVGTWVATASNWGSGVILVLVPAALQVVRHATVLETGALFLGFSVPYAIAGAVSGPISRRLGPRTAMATGLVTTAAGLGLLALVGLDAAVVALLVALAIAGAGTGIVYSVSTSYTIGDTRPADAGEASALLTMLRLLGLTLSVALSTSLAIWVDGLGLGVGSAGLRVALALAAVVTLAGVLPMMVRSRSSVSDAGLRPRLTGGRGPVPD